MTAVPGKVLITGAGGFVGSNLARYLAGKSYHVVALTTCDDSSPVVNTHYVLRLPDTRLHTIMREEQPDWVIHCAGRGSVQWSFAHPEDDFAQNVALTEFVLDTVGRNSPASKVVFISSGAVYGDPATLPITEQTPPRPISPYGFHKVIGELICRKHAAITGIPVTILRVFSAYGPGLRKQVLWDVAQKARATTNIVLDGTGEEMRDFIYIDDLCQAVQLVMHGSNFDANVINVASGESVTIAQLAHLMLAAIGDGWSVRFAGAARPGDPLAWRADVETLRRLGMRSWLPIDVGVRRYVDWLRAEGQL
jgi:UDP-glucose 4-epimerase